MKLKRNQAGQVNLYTTGLRLLIKIGLVFIATAFTCVSYDFYVEAVRVQADSFVYSNVVSALRQEDIESIKRIATPRFAESLETSKSKNTVRHFQNELGPLKHLNERLGARLRYRFGGRYTYPHSSIAIFEKTTATITLLLKRDKGWMLDGITINSHGIIIE